MICKKCQINKDDSEFYKYRKSECKKCYSINRKEVNKLSRKRNNNKRYEYNKKFLSNPNNKKKYDEYRKKWEKNRNNDPIFKFYRSISIRQALRGYTIRSKYYGIIGMDFKEFKEYIESKFEPWMNWDNYGKYNGEFNYGWDIDHIIPLSSAKTKDDVIKLNHYTNLRPLCSKVNRYIKKYDDKNILDGVYI